MADIRDRVGKRTARHARLRRKVNGTPERPRLVVFKSSKHIYAQLVDDASGKTITGVSSLTAELRKELEASKAKGIDVAKAVGKALAGAAKQKNIDKVVFDRGGFPYTGRVKALAEAARAEGLGF
ncbi:MAG: 50S ribosomal protein L18 [Candidatus Wallbacteria bacterium]|nr:50S ribosomal protein L18 [Candidatus Wallbacteria bacterium]MBI4867794.1 50S ribosomal protein L18 [Candidatus Wallbacteria bacterium]